ncbi:MAG: 4-alpha-glucanotransferase [Gemmatimonadota bacterium]
MAQTLEFSGRSSGVLLHPTSLPGPGVGDLGPSARRFVDWLVDAGQSCWQILPLVPVDSGGSPYNGLSALAGNPLLLSPRLLADEGLLEPDEAEKEDGFPNDTVDFAAVLAWKDALLRTAYRRLLEGRVPHLLAPFDEFREENESWLSDYSLFRAVRDHHAGASWLEWPEDIRSRQPEALERWKQLLSWEVDRYAFQQYLFHRQWRALHEYANDRGIRIIGDLPIFVAHDSADVWANPGIFQLDGNGRPTVVAGVPPDYFSATGQRWGNPLYRWDVLRRRHFDWWVERFRRTLAMVDVLRVDHFRGFESYWEIPAEEETAVAGRWVKGPGAEFFRALERELGPLPIIAEDLGLITPEVDELRRELDFPGMRVIQFAFDGDPANTHLPVNYTAASVAYTGTHDNDTIVGWWAAAGTPEREQARLSLKEPQPDAWDFIRAVLSSSADLAIIPLQDLLSLPSGARMNTPGRATDNWTWRLAEHDPDDAIAARLRNLTERTNRLPAMTARGPSE